VALSPGTRLGAYEILTLIGSGGMGEVYRAKDTKLGRDIALKILPATFTNDPDRVARFRREAQVLASLNHPHIAQIHGLDDANGTQFLVLELVDGESLDKRIARGRIPVDEAVGIAKQIAEALEAAHEKGIIHRDLKPANIALTKDGQVKVLDFGLAKTTEAGGTSLDLANSPTMTSPAVLTNVGVILGTAAYMSPEQARGSPVDQRTDIWSFGVILYEVLTGRRLFQRETVSDTLAGVLTIDPAWDPVSPVFRCLLQRCLAKDPRRRLRHIGDMALLLENPEVVPAGRPWLGWGAAAILLVMLASVTLLRSRERPQVRQPMRFQMPVMVNLFASGNLGISPDGRYLAFMGVGTDGAIRLWIRAMNSLEIRPLAGSETASSGPPFFWSPDSKWIAFDAGGTLKKIAVSGGPAQALCDLPGTAVGGSWNRSGDIILANTTGGLLRVSDAGGTTSPVTIRESTQDEMMHLLPSFLPDGRHFVYLRVSRITPEKSGVYVGTLDATPEEQSTKRLLPYVRGLTYAPPTDVEGGRLLFLREGTLMAQPFDERRLALEGDPVRLAENVGSYLDTGFFSVSSNGVLVYRTVDRDFQLTWFDRQGHTVEHASEPGRLGSLALSPDGSRAVVSRMNPQDTANGDLWLIDLSQGNRATRFTFGNGVNLSDSPAWSPDGSRIAFTVRGEGGQRLYQRLTSGAKDKEVLLDSRAGLAVPNGWSPDGRFLLYAHYDRMTRWDLWVLPLDGTEKPVPFAHTKFDEDQGRFAPDGRRVAFVSNESGTSEVYFRRFTADFSNGSASSGGTELVSRGGGTAPRWRADGRELFYVAPNRYMMAVAVTNTTEFRVGTPVPLFQIPPGGIIGDVTADGKRFLLATPLEQGAAAPFTVVLNWQSELAARDYQ